MYVGAAGILNYYNTYQVRVRVMVKVMEIALRGGKGGEGKREKMRGERGGGKGKRRIRKGQGVR